jgi:hypothetical protein
VCHPGGRVALVYGGRHRQRADRPRRRLRSCSPDSGDLPAIRRCAEGDAIRNDVCAVHVCEGLPSAGFLAVARSPGYQGEMPVPRLIMEANDRAEIKKTLSSSAMRSPGVDLFGLAAFRAELPGLKRGLPKSTHASRSSPAMLWWAASARSKLVTIGHRRYGELGVASRRR